MPRPLTQEEVEFVLAQGKDPAGLVYYGPDEQPSAAPVEENKTSALGSAARGAARSIIPGVASGLGMLAGTALAPETGGLSFIIPAAASFLAGGTAAAVQKLAIGLVSPELRKRFEESEAQDVKEHPLATLGGELVGGAVAGGLRPSIKNFRSAGVGVNELLKGRTLATLPEEQAANIKNIVGSTALNTGIEAGQQLYNKQLNVPALVGAAGTGMIFNQPTRLGEMYGFHPTGGPETSPTAQPDQVITPDNKVITPEQAVQRQQQREAIAKINASALQLSEALKGGAKLETPTVESKVTPVDINKNLGVIEPSGNNRSFLTAEQAAAQAQLPESQRQAPRKGVTAEPEEGVTDTTADFSKLSNKEAIRRSAEDFLQNRLKNLPDMQTAYNAKLSEQQRIAEESRAAMEDNIARQKLISVGMPETDVKALTPQEVKDLNSQKFQTANDVGARVTPEDISAAGGQHFQNSSFDALIETEAQRLAKTSSFSNMAETGKMGRIRAIRAFESKLQEQGVADFGARMALSDKLRQRIKEINIAGEQHFQIAVLPSDRVTPEHISAASVEASRRGVTLGRSELPITKPTGERAAGVSNSNRTAAVDTAVATRDTPTHEILERFMDDLGSSKSPRDQQLAKQLVDSFPDTSEGARENLMQMGGVAYADKLAFEASNPSLRSRAGEWIKDVKAAFKQRYGGLAPEDAARFLVNESKGRRTFSNDPFLGKSPEINAEQRFQTAQLPEREVYGKEISPATEPAFTVESARPTVPKDDDKVFSHYPNPIQHTLESAVDKVRHIGGKDAPIAQKKVNDYGANVLNEEFRLESRLNGAFREQFAREVEKTHLTAEEDAKLNRYRWEMQEEGESNLQGWIDSNPRLKKFNNFFQNLKVEARLHQNKYGMLVNTGDGFREGRIDPFYNAPIVSQKVRREVTDNSASPGALKLQKDLKDFWVKKGIPEATAEEDVKNYIQALGSNIADYNGKEFSALRKAQGMGLPYSWVEKSTVNQGLRYFSRFAKDMAYYRAVQSDPVARSLFNIPDQTGTKEFNASRLPDSTPINSQTNALPSNKLVQKAFDSTLKYQSDVESRIFAFSRAVTSGWLGPWSGLRDLTSSVLHNLPYVKFTDITRGLIPAIRDFNHYYEDSFRTGVNRSKINTLEFGNESVDIITERLNRFSDFVSKYQGRNLLEKITRGVQFGLGKEVARTVMFRGNPQETTRFINTFGKGIENPQQYIGKSKIPDFVLNEFAAQWVEHNQGTYDPRGLSSGAVKGQFAGLLSLARWGIEKQNTMYKDVWIPLRTEKDIMPLLKVTLGMFMGGEAVRKLGEVINNRLDYVPNWTEIAKSDKAGAGDIAANLASAANMAGYFGFVSQLAQSGLQLVRGKNAQQVLTIPAGDFITQNIGLHTQDFINAINSGEPLDKAFLRYLNLVAKDQIQSVKILEENVTDRESQERKKSLRNLAVFRDLEGKTTSGREIAAHPNITGMSARNFDQATTVGEARDNLPGAVNVAATRSQGDPTKLIQGIKAIPRIEDKTIPNPSTPQGARELDRYRKYIITTQGQDAWNKILNNYVANKQLTAEKKAAFVQYMAAHGPEIRKKYQAVGLR